MDARRLVLGTVIIVPLIVLTVLLVDYLITTPEERVATALHDLASDLQNNDVEGVLEHISALSPELRHEAKTRMGQFVIHRAIVKRNLETVVSMDHDPPVAKASFNGVIVLSDKMGIVTRQTVARYFVVHLREEDGQWRIRRYEDLDPIKRK